MTSRSSIQMLKILREIANAALIGQILAMMLFVMLSTSPASATDWRFLRAVEFGRGSGVLLTTTGGSHSIEVTTCDPQSPFRCARMGTAIFAVPKKPNGKHWSLDGARFEMIEERYGMRLFGTQAEGVLVSAVSSAGDKYQFLFSRDRGLLAFTFPTEPTGKQNSNAMLISMEACGPGANPAICKN